jgi:hypothetical protein
MTNRARPRSATAALATVASAVVAIASSVACSSPDTAARVDPVGPSRADFKYVAPVLSRRCGSLDCHGSSFRNMRVYGFGGQRLGAGGFAPDNPNASTVEEVNATYESVIALEPEIMRDVVQSGGASAERLTFVRKGRGDEAHKGDRRITPGDASDRCITSWLKNTIDVAACNEGGCVIETTDAGVAKIGQCL